jgi:hypothetical protein
MWWDSIPWDANLQFAGPAEKPAPYLVELTHHKLKYAPTTQHINFLLLPEQWQIKTNIFYGLVKAS